MMSLIAKLPQASNFAPLVDHLYDFIFWVSVVSFFIIVGMMGYFVLKYHRKRKAEDSTPYIEGHGPTEFAMAAVLFVLVMVIFAWGWMDYRKMLHSPEKTLEINIIGKQWFWNAEYPNGRKLKDELVVPEGADVKLTMTSADVIHSFYIPDFRIKQDVVPGQFTKLWFKPTKEGEYTAFCAEYCGFDHSRMLARVKVLRPKAFKKWYDNWKDEATQTEGDLTSPIEKGRLVFEAKACNACHTVDGKPLVGPSFLKTYGTKRPLEGGGEILMDENYVRESLMDPQLKISKGYPPAMPTFRGQLTDEEVNHVVAYLKSLSDGIATPAPQARNDMVQGDEESLEEKGEKYFEKFACNACHTVNGEKSVGPSLREIYGTLRPLQGGGSIEVSEKYLKESLINPGQYVVDGFPNLMPSYKHELSEEEIKALVEYIKGI
ncbi:MAG: cytochrome c oxidase subunit II [Deltaproteobacteria bacterium]|nr:cytochrome c oxidase subunit II [Deltaproteobacteria bacterium]